MALASILYEDEAELEKLSGEIAWLQWPFQEGKTLANPLEWSLIPERFANALNLQQAPYKSFNETSGVQSALHECYLPFLEAFISFKASRDDILIRYFLHINEQNPLTAEPYIQLHIDSHHMMVAVYNGANNLQLANSFVFQSREDILFYLLAAAKDNEIDPAKAPLYASGFLRKQTALFKLLSRYFAKLKLQDAPEGVTLDAALSSIPQHYFYSHLILPLCAL